MRMKYLGIVGLNGPAEPDLDVFVYRVRTWFKGSGAMICSRCKAMTETDTVELAYASAIEHECAS